MYITAFIDGALAVLLVEIITILTIAFISAWKSVRSKKK